METMPFPTTQSQVQVKEFVRSVCKGWMRMRQVLLGLVTLGMLLGCGTSPQFYGWPTQGGTGPPPVIEAYYAPQTFSPGGTLQIFLRAKDPDRDMLYIACTTYETGYGPLDTAEIPLTGNNRAEFSGYLAMPIPEFDPIEVEGMNFTLTILIRDQQGNASQPVQLSFTLDGGSEQAVPPQWQAAAKYHLGDIFVDPSAFTSSGVQGGDRGND
jgi:hypothetical protein